MKALGIVMLGVLAVAGGVAAATYITKKKLEKENEENYYDDWDDEIDDDDMDFEFDEDLDIEDESEKPEEPEEKPAVKSDDEFVEDKTDAAEAEDEKL